MNDKTPSWNELNQLYAVALERINNLRQSCEDRGVALEAAEADRDAHAQQIATHAQEMENAKIALYRYTVALDDETAKRNAAEARPAPACVHGHTKRQVGCVSCVLVFDNLGKRVTQHEPEGQHGRNADASTGATGERPVLPANRPAPAALDLPTLDDVKKLRDNATGMRIIGPLIGGQWTDDWRRSADELDAIATRVAALLDRLEQATAEIDAAIKACGDWAKVAADANADRDNYQKLAHIGRWHNDCRPNRVQALQMIENDRHTINTMADAVSAANLRAEAAEARATTAERERDQRHAEALYLATGLRDIGLLLAPTCDGEPSDDELVIDRVRQLLAERDRLQRELDAARYEAIGNCVAIVRGWSKDRVPPDIHAVLRDLERAHEQARP